MKTVKALIKINEELCKGCGLCIEVCPNKLIVIAEGRINFKGYHPAEFKDEEGQCTGCSFCAIVCPDVAIEVFR